MRAALFALLLLVWTSPAHAATILLLRPASNAPQVTEALFRLQGELLAVGLDVEVAPRPPGFNADTTQMNTWFEGVETDRRIDAVIDIVGGPIPVGVDIWIFQQSSGRFRATQPVLEPNTENAPETLAIRSIEVLRANFLVLDLPPRKPQADPIAEPEDDGSPRVSEPFRPVGVAAGAAVITSADGVGPAILPRLHLDWRLHPGLVAQATGSAFGTRAYLEGEDGAVRVGQAFGLLGLRYTAPSDAVLGAFLALGAGAMHTTLDGRADSPNRGHHLDQWAFVMEGSLGTTLNFSPRYHLCLGAHAQFSTPYVAIHFVDEQVASSGRPNLLASLTMGAWL